jgi:NAD(P)-dependent dehydrogenase (short-subunit alcohol dehydrogenase family)
LIILIIILFIFIFLIAANQFIYGSVNQPLTKKLEESEIQAITKAVIITGGNSGLDYSCAKIIALSNKRFKVIIVCRSEERAQKAVIQLIHDTGNSNISYLLLDLASFDSIRKFAHKFSNEPPLFDLICNAALAGGMGQEISFTEDKIEMIFGVSHLGHFC